MQVTRRFFLHSAGALAAYIGLTPMDVLAMGSRVPPPVLVKPKRTVVVVFLRGGADGLNLVTPFGDPHYARLRPTLALARPGGAQGVIDLDGFFGLHPRLAGIADLFRSGHARAAHAVGYANNTRSHFEEQDVWETGIIGNTVNSDGWLNRHLATSEGWGPIRAVSIGDSLPRILRGRVPAYAIRGLEDLSLSGRPGDEGARVRAALEHAYRPATGDDRSEARELLSTAGRATLDGLGQLQAIAAAPYTPTVAYPESPLATRLKHVARLIKADVGLEVAQVDLDGWDTHQAQGRGAEGAMGDLAQQLGDALGAFCRDLESRLDDVLVVTLTDFGRTAAENGTNGTDHGWANCVVLAGGAVARAPGGTVMGRWPGLAPDQLHEGRDLLHTTDFRDVLAEVVSVHLGNPNLQAILPAHQFAAPGLIA